MTRIVITIDLPADPGSVARDLGLPHAWALADHVARQIRVGLRDAGALKIHVETHKRDRRNAAAYDWTE